MKNKIVQCFLDTDMRMSFNGLGKLLLKNNIQIQSKEVGEFIVFINSRHTYLRIMACNGTPHPVIASYRVPSKTPIDLRVIAMIPKAFNASGKFDIDQATAVLLRKELGINE